MNNLAVIEGFIAAAMRGNRDEVAALCHPEFKLEQSEGLPYGGTYHGPDGFWKLLEVMFSTWSNPRIEALHMIGAPESSMFAIVMGMQGTAKASGKSFATTLCELWTVKDAKVLSIKPYYWDTKLMADLNRSETAAAP